MFTVTKNATSSDQLSLMGTLKAGLSIPVVKLNGSVSDELNSKLKTQAQYFQTYFWAVTKGQLPTFELLSLKLAHSLPSLDPDTTAIAYGSPVTGDTIVVGWPEELCVSSLWTVAANNHNFSVNSLTMTKKGAGQNGFPSCDVSVLLGLADKRAVDVSDPKLVMSLAANGSVSFPLTLDKALNIDGTPAALVTTDVATWSVVANGGNPKAFAVWAFPVHLDLPGNSWTLSSVSVGKSSNGFVCNGKDGGQIGKMTDVLLEGAPAPYTTLSGNQSDFRIDVRRSLLGVPQYNDDPSQANRRQCAISGMLSVTSVNQQNKKRRVDTVVFQTDTVFFPNELAAGTAPAVPAAAPAAPSTPVAPAAPTSAAPKKN